MVRNMRKETQGDEGNGIEHSTMRSLYVGAIIESG
jgi:hypothetical protein